MPLTLSLSDHFDEALKPERSFMDRNSSYHDDAIRPVHTTDHCQCEEIAVSEYTIIKIIEAGTFPLLTFSERSDGERKLAVSEYSLATVPQFIAFSHVRHLGLGSSTRNALPYCQLSLLQTIATSNDRVIPFWIDTMCVPLSSKAHKAALCRIGDICTTATEVVVLDPYLYCHAAGSATEALLRIKHSSWAKRLWTLQEGALAKKLTFRFMDKVCGLDDLLFDYEKDGERDNFSLLTQKRNEKIQGHRLAQMLAQLDCDLKTAEGSFTHVSKADWPFDRMKLRSVLRLGYLAHPKFYWILDEGDGQRLTAVIKALEKTYGELACEVASATARLELMMSMPLPEY